MPMAAVYPILSLIAGIILSLTFGFPIQLGIVFAILVTLVSVNKLGFSWNEMFRFGWGGIKLMPIVTIVSSRRYSSAGGLIANKKKAI